MAKSSSPSRPVGKRLASRLEHLRRERNLTLRDLAAKLKELGRPIQVSGLSKIENGDRRVDVDDLLALAAALDVSPNALLFPDPRGPSDETVQVAPDLSMDLRTAWQWALREGSPPSWDFFLSCSSADRDWANWTAGVLRSAGYRVWDGTQAIRPGDSIVETITSAIHGATAVIAMLSPHYQKSEWTQLEVHAAWSRRSRIVPVKVEPCEPKGALADLLWLDIVGLDENMARERLLEVANSLVPRHIPSEPPSFPR